MRFPSRGAALGAAALAAMLAVGATTASANLDLCGAAKKKCADTKMQRLLKCHIRAEAAGMPVQPACIAVVKARYDGGADPARGCFAKAEAKGGCNTSGDSGAIEAKVDAFVDDVVGELHTGGGIDRCGAGKKKCVLKKAAGMLKCHEKAERDGVTPVQPCVDTVKAKYDGAGVPSASCFAKVEAKGGCNTQDDAAALEVKVDVFVEDVVCEIDPLAYGCPPPPPTPSPTPQLPTWTPSPLPPGCPSAVTFVGTSTAGMLDAGWTGIAHDVQGISGGLVTVQVTGCEGTAPNCGICSYTGPIENAPGEIDSHRCAGDSTTHCTVDGDCAGDNGPCVYYLGSYLPLTAGGVGCSDTWPPACWFGLFCVANQFNGAVTGTFNGDTGESAGNALATATLYVGEISLDLDPCPKCVGDMVLNDGVKGGTCRGGANPGTACDAMGTHPIRHFGSTSLDCPPQALAKIADLPVNLANTTGSTTKVLSASSPNCRAVGFTTLKCMCDTCDNAAATPCSTNAECAAAGATVCGGKRCQGGGNNGTACTINSECPGGACGVPGLATAPNQCDDAICTPTTGNEGECLAGPFDQFCGPSATFQTCFFDRHCASVNICIGGSNDGALSCTVSSECPGGTCEIQTCSIGKNRPCFTDNGAIGGAITATGHVDPPVHHQSNPTLASLFCIGPLSSGALNSAFGLPGPVRLELPGHATDNGVGP